MVTLTWHLDVGLYEASEGGARWISAIWKNSAGEYKAMKMEDGSERLRAMLRLMDEGLDADAARRATKPTTATPAEAVR